MKRCVILSAGVVADPSRLAPLLREDDWFVVADGGIRLAQALGVTPSVIVADFDSGDEKLAYDFGAEIIRLPVEKDWTDTMAAAMLGLERGFREFLLLGCTGGRLDHTLANLAVLQYLLSNGAEGWIADEYTRVRLYSPGNYRVEPDTCYFSLLPYGGAVEGITLKNAMYPLENGVLSADTSLGVSNQFTENPLEISFKSGSLLFFLSKD